ncbi:sulfite oxidase [Lichtheimia corymbifera JMRC:FSU:9682]|uniref:Sulfite oxidase n=1 Tax=Lichtheimia corymbifera JMRC:FSU:9682 TaxID=1263082 RepID=A0A068RWF7_9FUNG|nr:sulfite oxidase [Lichtheimia corymbifera JMRC:FSU:9682]
MNGKPLARDHGYPLRVVIPGYIGARSVKFLQTIRIQDKESNAYHQQLDYKILPEHVENEKEAEKYWSKVPAIGEYNVQSFVCTPPDGMMDDKDGNEAVSCQAEGYALSGGGRSIQRVGRYVSGDEGKTWVEAQLHTQPFEERDGAYTWSWTLWKATVKAHKVDSAGNIQQENPVWNYRGVLSNAWRTMVTPEKDKR